MNQQIFDLRTMLDSMVFGTPEGLSAGIIPYPVYIANFLMSVMEQLLPIFAVLMLIGVVYQVARSGSLKQSLAPEIIRIVTVLGVMLVIFSVKDTTYKSRIDGKYGYAAITLYTSVFKLGEDLADALFYELTFNGNGANYSPFGDKPDLDTKLASINNNLLRLMLGPNSDPVKNVVEYANEIEARKKALLNGEITLLGHYNKDDVIKTYYPFYIQMYKIRNLMVDKNRYTILTKGITNVYGENLNKIMAKLLADGSSTSFVVGYQPIYGSFLQGCTLFKTYSMGQFGISDLTTVSEELVDLKNFKESSAVCSFKNTVAGLPKYKNNKELLVAVLTSQEKIFEDMEKKLDEYISQNSVYMSSKTIAVLNNFKNELSATVEAYKKIIKGINEFGQPTTTIKLEKINYEISSTIFKTTQDADIVFQAGVAPAMQNLISKLKVIKEKEAQLANTYASFAATKPEVLISKLNEINDLYYYLLYNMGEYPDSDVNPLYAMFKYLNIALQKGGTATGMDPRVISVLNKLIYKPLNYIVVATDVGNKKKVDYLSASNDYLLKISKIYLILENSTDMLSAKQINEQLNTLNEGISISDAFKKTLGYDPILDLKIPTQVNEDAITKNVRDYLKTGNIDSLKGMFYTKRTLSWVDIGYFIPALKSYYSQEIILANYMSYNMNVEKYALDNLSALKVNITKAYLASEYYKEKYAVGKQIARTSTVYAGLMTAVKGGKEILDFIKTVGNDIKAGIAGTAATGGTIWILIAISTIVSLIITGAKIAFIYIIFYIISFALLYMINYLVPPALWMMAVLSWFFKVSVLTVLFPINLVLMFFRDKVRNVMSMIYVLFGQALVPVVMVAIFFIIITFSSQLEMLINAFIPSINHYFIAGFASEILQNIQPREPSHWYDVIGWLNYIKDSLSMSFSDAIQQSNVLLSIWGMVVDSLKMFIMMVINFMLYMQFFRADNYVGEVLGERVEAQALDANRLMDKLRVTQVI